MSTNNKRFALLLLVFLAYFLLRTINLTLLPIFNDESTYIRYGLHQLNEPTHQPYSLLIGKEPLLPFLYALFGTITGNLLVGARLVTIGVGLFTLSGIFLLTKALFSEEAAFFASFFYCIAPYTVFFDRLALMDSGVSTIAVWTLYLTHLVLQKAKWRYGIALGLVMGIGLWVKTSDLFFVFLPLISYFIYFSRKGDDEWTKAKLFFSALFLCLFIFLPLYSNSFYVIHMQLVGQYTYSLFSVFAFPFAVWWNNFANIIEWLFFYLTPPLFLLAVGSLFFLRKQKHIWPVFLWLILPFLYEMLYAKLFTSRHVLLLTVPLFIVAGYGFSLLWKKRKIAGIVIGICILLWSLYDDSVLLTSPQKYPQVFVDRARVDVQQYVYGFSSGYGVSEAIHYLQNQAATQHIIVYIRNDHGNPEDAVVAYLDYKSNVTLVPLNESTIATDILKAFAIFKNQPQYFVSRGSYHAGMEKYFAWEKQFAKPNDIEFVGVEKMRP